MMLVWYQPTKVMNQKRLVHLCNDDAKTTLCGKEINSNWILWDKPSTGWDDAVTCKKCYRIDLYNKKVNDNYNITAKDFFKVSSYSRKSFDALTNKLTQNKEDDL